jgi:hypothetical protein
MPGMGSTEQSREIAMWDIHSSNKKKNQLSQKPIEWQEMQNEPGLLNFTMDRADLPMEL